MSGSTQSLNVLPGIPSGLAAFLGFTLWSTILTSSVLTVSDRLLVVGSSTVPVSASFTSFTSKREKKWLSSSANEPLPLVVYFICITEMTFTLNASHTQIKCLGGSLNKVILASPHCS